MLAPDRIIIRLGGEAVLLRPTLAAAIRLERRHGLDALVKGIHSMSLSILTDIVDETASCPVDLDWRIEAFGLDHVLDAIALPCVAIVNQLYLFDRPVDETASDAPGLTWAEGFQSLYEQGTGLLGWTPADTLDASPAEIDAAAKGRWSVIGDVLKVLYPAPRENTETSAEPDWNAPRDPDASATLRELQSAVTLRTPKIAEPPPPKAAETGPAPKHFAVRLPGENRDITGPMGCFG